MATTAHLDSWLTTSSQSIVAFSPLVPAVSSCVRLVCVLVCTGALKHLVQVVHGPVRLLYVNCLLKRIPVPLL